MTEGLASVIIPTYNRERLLKKTLQSVFTQDYQNLEVLIVDDGSTDATEAMVAQARKSANGIAVSYIRVAHQGCANARNIGMQSARGEYIQHLDSDDLLLPGKIGAQVAFLQRNPRFGAVYCYSNVINDSEPPTILSTKTYKANDVLEFALRPWVSIFDPVVLLWRKAATKKLGGYDARLCRWVDWDFLIRYLTSGGEVGCLEAILSQYRVHPNRVTSARHGKDGTRDAESMVTALEKAYPGIESLGRAKLLEAFSERVWTTMALLHPVHHRDYVKRLEDLIVELKRRGNTSMFVRLSCNRDGKLSKWRANCLLRLYDIRTLLVKLKARTASKPSH